MRPRPLGANILDADGFAGDERERARIAHDLPAALAFRSVDDDHFNPYPLSSAQLRCRAHSTDKAAALVKTIAAQGGHGVAIKADSANAAAIASAVVQFVAGYSKIDLVLVNAGLFRMNSIEAVSLDELDAMLAVNVRGVYLSIQTAVPHVPDGGRIITIGSNVAIHTGFPGSSVYQMTKGAIAAMVKGVALDLAARRITVNNIQPGPTDTDINTGAIEMLSEKSPLKRVAKPEEIAGLVSYLSRDEAGYITGASLTIDGGFTL